MSSPTKTDKPKEAPLAGAAPPASRPSRRRLLGLATPVLLIPILVALSSFWHVSTHVRLDVSASRLALTPEGSDPPEILNRSVTFSSLTLEKCGTVTFPADALEIADPARLLPATRAGEAPRFPPEAWQKLSIPGPVRFVCSDPAAKLTIQAPGRSGEAVGVLDRIPLEPGRLAIVEVSAEKEPSVSLELEGPRKLDLVGVGPDVEVVADLTQPEGIRAPFPGSLQTYRTRLPESHRTVEIESGAKGLTLIFIQRREPSGPVFREGLNLPLKTVELLEEKLEGDLSSALRDKATLTYVDYPAPAVTVESVEIFGLGGLSRTRLLSLALATVEGKATLRASLDGVVERAAGQVGAFRHDHRLTLFDIFRYSKRWGLVAAAAVWAFSAAWAAFEIWKKLHE